MNYIDYSKEWSERVQAAILAEDHPEGAPINRDTHKRAVLKALPGYLLFSFCQELRATHATPWEPLEGLKAVQLYVIQKHHWDLAQVQSLSEEQLQFVLHEELCQVELTDRAYDMAQSDIAYLGMAGLKLKQKPAVSP